MLRESAVIHSKGDDNFRHFFVTCLEVASGLGAQIGQVDVGLTAVDDWIGVFAGPFGR